eukprot:jgi/Chrzof1/9127/Cz03g36280.t1
MAERTAVVPQRQRWHMSHDNLKLSFSGGLPDQVKLIKNLSVYPLVFTAMLSYDLRHQTFGWGFTCIEDFLHGRISFNTAHRAIEYRKSVPLPFGIPLRPEVAAEWSLDRCWHKPRVCIGFMVDQSTTIVDPGTIQFRNQFFVRKRFGLETQSKLKLSMEHQLGDRSSSSIMNGLSLHLDVNELNLLVRV